jgi:hypothetical protein
MPLGLVVPLIGYRLTPVTVRAGWHRVTVQLGWA